MAHQYFDDNTELPHDFRELDFQWQGEKLSFQTDSGVFSRESIDFGSRTLLDTIAEQRFIGMRILDVGCGYGPIGLSLAKVFPETKIEMVDVSERALALAERNAGSNQVDNVTIYASDMYDQVEMVSFDHIISNPPIRAGKKVVHGIISGAYDHLQHEGRLTIVIQKKQGASSAKQKMQEVYGNVTELTRKKGYWILQSIK